MALARNNAVVLSEAAPQAAVTQDVMSVGIYDALVAGNPLTGMNISTNPDPLELGQRYEIAVDALELYQPVAGGAQITQTDGALPAAAADIVVDSAADLTVNEHFVLNGRAYRVAGVNVGTRTVTLDRPLVEAVADNTIVQVALETEEMARRKLRGVISNGLWVAYFSTVWTDTNTGTLNLIALARSPVAEANWTVT